MTAPLAAFRADGGAAMGGGHIARCLAFADELVRRGWRCAFAISAETRTTMPHLVVSGHELFILPPDANADSEAEALRARWPSGPALLVVDHYGRDIRHETVCHPWAKLILVIDDLADRPHHCDLLLDPTLGRSEDDYRPLVPPECRLLLGPDYGLLKPEFAALRPASLTRRATPQLRRLLISCGVTDSINATGACLDALKASRLQLAIDVVLGSGAPHLDSVRAKVGAMRGARLHIDTGNMAALMAEADCALGGGGSTTWERCCLGLPTVMAILAGNQGAVATALAAKGAAIVVGGWREGSAETMVRQLADLSPSRLAAMSAAAAPICDGSGILRAAEAVEALRGGPS